MRAELAASWKSWPGGKRLLPPKPRYYKKPRSDRLKPEPCVEYPHFRTTLLKSALSTASPANYHTSTMPPKPKAKAKTSKRRAAAAAATPQQAQTTGETLQSTVSSTLLPVATVSDTTSHHANTANAPMTASAGSENQPVGRRDVDVVGTPAATMSGVDLAPLAYAREGAVNAYPEASTGNRQYQVHTMSLYHDMSGANLAVDI